MAGSLTALVRRQTEEDVEAIMELVRENDAELIVVGLPRSLEGGIGPQAQKVLAFVDLLAAASPVPVESWDERLSTVAAERILGEMGVKRGKRRERRDSLAAAIILQGYIDAVRRRSERERTHQG